MVFWKGRAPELTDNLNGWVNTDPLTLRALKGRVVLLDFWAYSCVNCRRTLPALKKMWEKYGGDKFVIIGVHTPEFDFEKDFANVEAAVKRLEITYPVASDPDRETWNRYGNKYWPRSALINPKGEVVLEHVGESGYDEIERAIAKELGLEDKIPIARKRAYDARTTPEAYTGYARNESLGSRRVCTKHGCEVYYDPGDHERGVIYLAGDWEQAAGYVEFKGGEGHISLRYYAREVNAVMSGDGVAGVFVNDEPVPKAREGGDMADGAVRVDHPDMYNVVKTKEYEGADLKIIPFKGMRVYAYTFG